MRFFLLSTFVLTFLLANLASAKKNKKTTPVVAKVSVSKGITKDTSKTPPVTSRKTSYLKPDHTPKKTYQQLTDELNTHLTELQTVCNLKQNRSSELTQKLQDFRTFLITNLINDPYMVYRYRLEFGDILELISKKKNNPPLISHDFASSYGEMYNLPEDTKSKNYYHPWAKTLLKVFKCAEETTQEKQTVYRNFLYTNTI